MPDFNKSIERLVRLLGPGGFLRDSAARLVYSRDASHLTLGLPLGVALPESPEALRETVRICADAGLAVVTRGTGTGLSGGAVPNDGEVVLATVRLARLGPVDTTDRRVRSEVGVLNDQVSSHAVPGGLHFAPDPSSQSAASIGGNIAENAGGPHCLRHGVTLQHLLRLEWCDVQGRDLITGRGLSCERDINLTSLLCGSEGTLGVITAADLKLVPNPESVATLAAFFPDLDDATRAVVALLGEGLRPVAVEMIDQPMLEAVEAAFGFGFPTDVAAAMILEFAGRPEETVEDAGRARDLLDRGGAREVRQAEDEAARLDLWKCRKKAFGAVGRLAPSYVTMDVVVPLGQLPGLVREIQVIKRKHGVEIATAFHAGDGNLHPGVHFDDRDPELKRAAHAAADEIMHAALARNGSVSGEHGIGIEKLHAAPWQLDRTSLDLMWGVKQVFDPGNRLNPGKALPPREAECAPPTPIPSGCEFNWDSLTVTTVAEVSLADLQAQALERGLWLPVGLAEARPTDPGLGGDRTIGSLIDHLLVSPFLMAGGTTRDFLLELWAETGHGRLLHSGAPVFKNVVGYQLAQMLCGSGGVLATPKAATFQLKPAPELLGVWRFSFPGNLQPDFEGLLDILAQRDSDLGGPMAILDSGEPGTLIILVPGRDRSWDLDAWGRRLETAATGEGLELLEHRAVPFRAWVDCLECLPGWACASPDWTAWACSASASSSLLPMTRPDRWIWQGAPRLLWTPGEGPLSGEWHGDSCCLQGRPTALPKPAPGVPLDLLRGLKRLFDPEYGLETPAWLGEDTDE